MRIGDGGGYGPITGNTYHIKTMAVTPSSAGGYTAAQIEQLFSWLDPGAASAAGSAHTAAGKTLTDIADSLVKHVQTLTQNWTGTAAQGAVGNFRQLHQTAVGLAQASAQTGAVLSWLGNVVLPWYKAYTAPSNGIVGSIETLFGSNPQDKAAQAVMERLNNRLVQGNSGLPSSVTQYLSINGASAGNSGAPMTNGPAGAGGGGGGLNSLATGGGGGGVGSLGGGTGGGGLGHLGTGGGGGKVAPIPVTHLAGNPPPAGGTGPGAGSGGAPGPGGLPGGGAPGSAGPGGGPGGGGFPFPGGGVPGEGGTGGGAGGLGSDGVGGTGPDGIGTDGTGPGGLGGLGEVPGGAGLPGDGVGPEGMIGVLPGDGAVMGPDGMIGMAPGDPGAAGLGAGDASAAGAAGADGTAAGTAESGMGFPVSGAAGGRRERERRRQAWMEEEADVWESPVDLVPALIGG